MRRLNKVRGSLAKLGLLLGASLCVLIVLLFTIDLKLRYDAAIAQGKSSAQDFAEILSEHTALIFDNVERTLREAEKIRKDTLAGNYATSEDTNTALQLLVKTSPVVVAVGWTDDTGKVTAHSYTSQPARTNVSGMAHFDFQRDSTERRLYVAPPFRSAASNNWLTAASLRLDNKDGSFAGILTAPIDPSYFVKIYRGIDLGSDGSILMIHRDGLVLAREPALENAMGVSFASGPLLSRHVPESDAGSYESVSAVDGVPRIAGYKVVRGLPLVVLVSYGRDTVLRNWYRHLLIFGPFVAFAAAAILLGTWLSAKQARILAEQSTSLRTKSHELERTNALFDMALSQMPNGLVMWDGEQRIVIANSRYRQMYGLTPAQVAPGTSLRQFVETYLANGGSIDLSIDDYVKVVPTLTEQVHALVDGRVVATRRQPTPDGGWIATHQDITEHKRAEALLRTTLDTMDQGLIAVDRDGWITLINPRALDLLGLPGELASSRPHKSEILAYQRRIGEFPSDEAYHDVVRDIDERRHAIYERERPNGTVLEVRTVPTDDGGFVRTYTDITARRAAEAELRLERDRAEAAARATAEFLANMSHELRTPLTAIIGVSEMLLSAPHSPERQRYFMEMQRNAGKGLLGIVSDILDFSKIETGQLRLEAMPLSLTAVANECLALVSDQAQRKGLDLAASVALDVDEWVIGDAARLRQVLLNLAGNAVKFTPSGVIRLTIERDGRSACAMRFTVSDTGIGIAPRDLETLFQRFVQADSSTTRRFGGSGLGLAICKQLVALMGGRIEVESTPGRGSVFSFVVDLPPAQEPQRDEASAPAACGIACRLLLAEDNPVNRELIKAMLEQAGHTVETASDGAEAVRKATRSRFDAILMDVQMPEMDGYTAARIIRDAAGVGPPIPIIALTANALPGEAERCIGAGMNAHIPKPVIWPALFATIERLVLESRQGQSARTQVETEPAAASPALQQTGVLDDATFGHLRRAIGDENTAKLLKLFAVEARQFLAGHPDISAARRSAHTFGGSAGMLGFLELADGCRMLQTATGDDFERAAERCRRARDAALAIVEALLTEDGLSTSIAR